ncbi:MAG: hypothetical protein L6R41_005878 [Letrouitia leprolyta]|nr:MAG: hypothetical protein L6R41_005878 [Letrouitia leprolyta]
MAEEKDYSSYIVYGPDANCTLSLCPASLSIYQYQPSLPANVVFLVLFGVAMLIHVLMGLKWRTWFFVIFCITLGPTFYTAGIYITLYKIILYLGPEHARFPPKAYYWIFIPCDILSLVLQSIGGALSSTSSGGSRSAVNVSITGLSFQVFTLLVFIGLTLEFSFRWRKARRTMADRKPVSRSFKIFVWFLSLSTLLILIRCIYRIDELSDGYNGPLIHDQGLFIGLEGVMVLIAVYCLMVAHPGPVFVDLDDERALEDAGPPADVERSKEAA